MTESLVFPENVRRSEEIKGLLRRMLVVNEEERISWNELFAHHFVKPIEEVVEKSSDSLLQSYRENENYMKNNKVASKTSSMASMESISKPKAEETSKKDEIEIITDFDKDVKLQNEKISDYLKID
jgi:serine/threonine-protein kinase ULK/ATG1